MEKFLVVLIAVYLALPASIVEAFPFIAFYTPDTIKYDYLEVKLGFTQVIIFLSFLYVRKNIITYALLFTLFLVFLGDLMLESDYPIDLLYSYLFGIFLYSVLTYIYKSGKIEWFLIINVSLVLLSQLISLWLGLNKIEGRINAPYLDVGNTGVFYSILGLTYSNSKLVHALVFFVTLLSGSRIGLLLYIVLFLYNYVNRVPKYLFVLVVLMIVVYSGELIQNLLRVSELARINEDDSLLGRIASFKIGFNVQEFGIGTLRSGELVSSMREGGYPTFPHSTFLVYLFIFPLYVVLSLKSIFKLGQSSVMLMFVFLIVFVLQGGLLTTFKSFGLSLFIFLNVYNVKRYRYFKPLRGLFGV